MEVTSGGGNSLATWSEFMRNVSWVVALLFAAALLLRAPSNAQSNERNPAAEIPDHAQSGTVRDLPLVSGQQRVLYARPQSPRGIIVMLPGGAGDVGIDDDGDFVHDKNFVIRTRALWLARGYAVIIPDAVDGQNMRGLRSSPEYAKVIQDLVRFAHAESAGPVFLLGTSQGSIAAMNSAAHLSKGELTGVVLTESVSRQSKSGETVFDALPDRVTVPALIVANRDSACRVAPSGDAPRIATAMTRAPAVKVLYVQGGVTRSTDCGSESPHGYFGIENAVVDKIAAWLDAHTPAPRKIRGRPTPKP
jgi:pimeloyl-ACP methyl ester carboxylesterase